MAGQNKFETLNDIVCHIRDLAADANALHVDDILSMIGSRSFGPLLVVPALVAVLPVIGAIPGATIICGLTIILIAVQILVGRSHAWVPARIRKIPLDRAGLKRGSEAFEPTARWIDGRMRRRLAWATRGMGLWLTALLLVMLGAVMLPTALIPWGVLVPGTAALILALGITTRDGLIVVFGWVLSLAAFAAVYAMAAQSGAVSLPF